MPIFKFDIGDEVYFCVSLENKRPYEAGDYGIVLIEKGIIIQIISIKSNNQYIYYYKIRYISIGCTENEYHERYCIYETDLEHQLHSSLSNAILYLNCIEKIKEGK